MISTITQVKGVCIISAQSDLAPLRLLKVLDTYHNTTTHDDNGVVHHQPVNSSSSIIDTTMVATSVSSPQVSRRHNVLYIAVTLWIMNKKWRRTPVWMGQMNIIGCWVVAMVVVMI